MKIPEKTMAAAIYHARKIAEEKNIPSPTESEVLPLEKHGQFYVFRFREWLFGVEEETGTCWPVPHSGMSATRTCPHCGKTVESEIPDGWIKVPIELWNKMVGELNRVDHIADCEKKLEGFSSAIELARVHLEKAQLELDAARRATE